MLVRKLNEPLPQKCREEQYTLAEVLALGPTTITYRIARSLNAEATFTELESSQEPTHDMKQLNPLFVDLVTLVITYLVTSFLQHLVVPFISLTVVKTNVNRQDLSMFVSTEIWAWRHCKQNRATFI
jgi:hypothetical protein